VQRKNTKSESISLIFDNAIFRIPVENWLGNNNKTSLVSKLPVCERGLTFKQTMTGINRLINMCTQDCKTISEKPCSGFFFSNSIYIFIFHITY
jgi:hypothetical protein